MGMTLTLTTMRAMVEMGNGTSVGGIDGDAGVDGHVFCQDKTPAVMLHPIRSSRPTSIATTPDLWIHLCRHNSVSPVRPSTKSRGSKESPRRKLPGYHADNGLGCTGSAVYVYALIPLGAAPANSTPTFMNLTFLLDSHPAGTYQHSGTASASGFLPSQLIFAQTGLVEAPHNLTVQIGPDSVLLLDYILYTKAASGEAETSSTTPVSSSSGAPGAQETGSGTGSPTPSVGPGTSNLCV